MGLLAAMVVGVVMAFRKTVSPKLVLAHKLAMFVVAVGMVGGLLFHGGEDVRTRLVGRRCCGHEAAVAVNQAS